MLSSTLPLSLVTLLLPYYTIEAFAAPPPNILDASSSHIPLYRRKRDTSSWSSEELGEWARQHRNSVSAKYGRRSTSATKRSTGTNLMVNQGLDSSFYGSLAVGTPAVSFNVILDTGSADLWIADTNCVTGCSGVPTFDSSTSSTFQNLTTGFEITYGSGQATGSLGKDVIQMAGFSVSEQTFAVADEVSTNMLRSPVSGLLGLAWSSISTAKATPFWQALVEGGAWDDPVMAFQFTRYGNATNPSQLEPGGTFTMGSANSSLYTGDIDYISIPDGQSRYWTIPLTSVSVNGNSVSLTSTGTTSYAAIDTGTTLVAGPASDIANIYAQIPGSTAGTGNYEGYYAYPCDTSVSVDVSFGGRTWTISPADFRYSQVSSELCLGAFFTVSSSSNSPGWIFGDTFLKNVYSVFRYNPASVGFANLSATAIAMNGDDDAAVPAATIGSVSASATGSLSSKNGADRTQLFSVALLAASVLIQWLL